MKDTTKLPLQLALQMERMAERNHKRMLQIREAMGTKWLFHPANKKGRIDGRA